MTVFRHPISVGASRAGPFDELRAVVDTGSAYTWVAEDVLERLGMLPEFTQEFETAEGRVIEREIAEATVRINGATRTTLVIFGDGGAEPLLGAHTLQAFSLAVDPVNERLVPVRALLKAARFEVQGSTSNVRGQSGPPDLGLGTGN